MDPYIAERLVAGKQAELRGEAKRAALRAALARKSPVTEYDRSIGAIGVARRLLPFTLLQRYINSLRDMSRIKRYLISIGLVFVGLVFVLGLFGATWLSSY